MSFARVIVVDWSAANGPKRGPESIWIGQAGAGVAPPVNPATRAEAEAVLAERIAEALAAGERVLVGADFPFGYPVGLARALTGRAGGLAVWDWLADRLRDDARNVSNRFDVAAQANAALPGIGPFWGRPAGLDLPGLPARGRERQGQTLPELRMADLRARGAQSAWKLMGAGSVGSQALTGIPRLQALRRRFAGQVAVWPFEPVERAPVVLAEVFPSLLRDHVARAAGYSCRDAAQVDLLARALHGLGEGIAALLAPEAPGEVLCEEGWILGLGHEAALQAALGAAPPALRDDCFALPPGVDWVPVEAALARLRAALAPVVGVEDLPTARAGGRVLAMAPVALRANPPAANSAVDGYGLAGASLNGPGPYRLPLVAGRAAAGQPLAGAVPAGHAVRILTGAILPEGVDTVVMDEDCTVGAGQVGFGGPVRPRANTRPAGEDLALGAPVLAAGRRLRAPDLALLSAAGIGRVAVHRPLRVAVLSTGDEIAPEPAPDLPPHRIVDANRPMLLELLRRWGHEAVDLGHAPDRTAAVRRALDRGAGRAQAILTSGGASAGDEDHVARLLAAEGRLSSWRIAMKPGRPLALALWRGVPVFGLPGNPVAALVCALVFARPALSLMAGSGWTEPWVLSVPAAFAKRKKAGRREYLRARLTPGGAAEVFHSEGSGLIGGLSWAEGLVELPEDAAEIVPGVPVRYWPFAGFGLG